MSDHDQAGSDAGGAALVRSTLRTLQQQRRLWVQIPGADWAVQLRRPAEADMHLLREGIRVEHVVEAAVDWRGVTPAHLIGPAGGSDALPFDAALWGEWVRDHTEAARACIAALAEAITRHLQARVDAGKD